MDASCCRFCGSDQLHEDDLGFMVCMVCGIQALTATQERSEFQVDNSGLQIRRVGAVARPRFDPFKVSPCSFTALTLECFQVILFKQTKEMIERFHAPTALTKVVKTLWQTFLESWRQDGWGNQEHLNTSPVGLKVFIVVGKSSVSRFTTNPLTQEDSDSSSDEDPGSESERSPDPRKNELPPSEKLWFCRTEKFDGRPGSLDMLVSVSLLFFALRILRFPVYAEDIIRWVAGSDISFRRARNVLPPTLIKRIDHICPLLHYFFSYRECNLRYFKRVTELVADTLFPRINVRVHLDTLGLNFRAVAYRVVAELNLPARFGPFLSNLCEYWRRAPLSLDIVCSGVVLICQLMFGSRSGEATIVEESDPAANLPVLEDWLKLCCPHFCQLHFNWRVKVLDPCENLKCEDETVRLIRENALVDRRLSHHISDYLHLFEAKEREAVEPTPVTHPPSMEYKDTDIIVDVDCLCEVPDLPPQHPCETLVKYVTSEIRSNKMVRKLPLHRRFQKLIDTMACYTGLSSSSRTYRHIFRRNISTFLYFSSTGHESEILRSYFYGFGGLHNFLHRAKF